MTAFLPMLSQLHEIPGLFWLLFCMSVLVVLGAATAGVTMWSQLRSKPPHEVPTRREFDTLSTRVQHIELSIPQMERRILEAVEKSSERLAVKIAEVSHEDQELRMEIFRRINDNDKQIARLGAQVGEA